LTRRGKSGSAVPSLKGKSKRFLVSTFSAGKESKKLKKENRRQKDPRGFKKKEASVNDGQDLGGEKNCQKKVSLAAGIWGKKFSRPGMKSSPARKKDHPGKNIAPKGKRSQLVVSRGK